MRTEKGQPGYVKARKQKYLLGAVVEFAIVIAIFVTGYIQAGSRLNLLTVVAVVGCLPAAKMLVEFHQHLCWNLSQWHHIRVLKKQNTRSWRKKHL